MNQPYTLYRHHCANCGAEYISEFRGSFSAAKYDHLDECPDAIAIRQAWAERRLTIDAARVNASNEAAAQAIAEFDAMIKGANSDH